MCWKPIEGFENYEVSREGDIRNARNLKIMSTHQFGGEQLKVQLRKDGRYYTKAVARIVAEAWVEERLFNSCDTPMHLNGHRLDCRADNLVWRPLWYVRKFHLQRKQPLYPNWTRPFYCEDTGENFRTPFECGAVHGLLEEDIYQALRTGCKAFLIGYRYAFV